MKHTTNLLPTYVFIFSKASLESEGIDCGGERKGYDGNALAAAVLSSGKYPIFFTWSAIIYGLFFIIFFK